MKKLFIITCLLMVTVCSKAQSGNEYIDRQVYLMQQTLPLKCSEGDYITAVEFKDNSYIVTHELSQDLYFTLSKTQKTFKKALAKSYVKQKDLSQLIMELMKANANMKHRFECRHTSLSFTITITPDDFIKAYGKL